MKDTEICAYLQIDVTVLDLWIEQHWLVPEKANGSRVFRQADLARGRLILDLVGPMGVNDDGVDVAMNLLDQLHSLRGKLAELLTALRAEEPEVQERILSRIEKD